ncbi:MAG: response regulator [Desulfobacterales bacterium]
MSGKRTLLIVDDHALFREGLKAIISRDNSYEIVGETGRGDEAVQMAKSLKPDLVLVDISLPDQSGIELARQLRRCLPDTALMIVSMHSKVDYIVKAFQAGATGYIVKDSAPERLLRGIDLVLQGEYFMDASVSQQVVQRLAGLDEKAGGVKDKGYDTLTEREQEVLVLLAQGIPLKKIGEQLFISPKTVENHRTHIMQKLGVQSSFELIRYAARIGLIDIDQWKD